MRTRGTNGRLHAIILDAQSCGEREREARTHGEISKEIVLQEEGLYRRRKKLVDEFLGDGTGKLVIVEVEVLYKGKEGGDRARELVETKVKGGDNHKLRGGQGARKEVTLEKKRS